ncbi:DNA polymerase III, alpha subunit, Gram-positive type [Lachnoanaerobaculum sp. ICM7]|uniref:PolC-type DNA polymerase III n=1 Tax=Lachnoanaerobaculum sp. ICM7 TaxID=936594 RepID=UPI00027A6166|nr:PolC-type DNA polymerase III [Lachnoanaerobaculum sp. ICM7]EJP19976.1 DNA polymerase III, alpha subunit, Gram-positive type [Lachnoanaerobaculum sp. ICM7]
MLKKFKDVFQSLECSGHIDELLNFVFVEKVSASNDMSLIKINIISERIIEKKTILDLEKLIKDKMFPKKNVKIKIFEKFKLSSQYTAQNLFETYRDSILLEIKNYKISQYVILNNACITFDGSYMDMTVEKNPLNESVIDELVRILEKIFNERCGILCTVRHKFIARKERNEEIEYAERTVTKKSDNSDFVTGNANAAWENGENNEVAKSNETAAKSNPKKDTGNKKFGNKGFDKKGYTPKYTKQKSDNPDVIYGRDFDDNFIKLSDLIGEIGEVTVRGKIIEVESRYLERSDSTLYIFAITDFSDSIYVKMFVRGEQLDAVKANIVKGNYIKVNGMALIDKFDSELTVSSIKGIKKCEKFEENIRMDNEPVKRVELHCHTKMSDFDGVSSASDIINQVKNWGMDAIAITDHGNIQGFTEASHVKNPPKIIYGVEGYLVDDLKELVTNPSDKTLDDGFIVFDIETTGFSAKNDAITEIGAVKVVKGEIVDRFSTFVNPRRPIPFKIEELTHINDAMVMNAPIIEDILPQFLDFCEDYIIVAHNAGFDTGFIRENAKRINREYNPSIIDTVAMARLLLPDLNRFKLDTVCKALNISLEGHHRAVNDAEATAQIWVEFIRRLKNRGLSKLSEVASLGETNADIVKKTKYNHVIILAKNDIGRINLYKLISLSHIDFFNKRPRIPKSILAKMREGLIIGSACEQGEVYKAILDDATDDELNRIVSFYDYLEIQPIGNNMFLLEDEQNDIHSIEDLQDINRRIVELGNVYEKPVVATCDVHFLNPEDEIYRRIIFYGKGYKDADTQPPLYLRTTKEMLDEFEYLGSEKAYEVVVTNTRMIADMVEVISPVRPDKCPPVIENSDEDLTNACYKKAHEQYGEELPKIVEDRLKKELNSIISNGFAVMYIIAKKLVEKSNEDGYLVGSRGSVGSSFAAYTSGITEVNPLPAHYYCDCKYVDFDSPEVKAFAGMAGCDMPDKICPKCGKKLKKDGFDIPFETFLGFKGDKEPDIDLNFSGEYQPNAHEYTEVIFGKGYTYRAGTVGTLANKTAYGYVKHYFDDKNESKRKCEINRLAVGCEGVRRTTGQHPGGIIVLPHGEEIYTFTPVQRPANDMTTKTITTHFDYHAIDHNLLKLDILGHQDPTMIRMLQDLTGIDPVKDIPLDSKETMSLFQNTSALGIEPKDILDCPLGALGVPEFGTDFAMQMLIDTKPQGLSDLVRIAGLAHGTDVWLGNAQTLILEGKATIRTAICTRDDIMIYLIEQGLDEGESFKIMESVRKGKGLTDEWVEHMEEKGVPDWYIWSCKKIKYMFPKAHAAAYVMMAWRIAYCKIFYPLAYYTAYFTIRATGFNYSLMCMGKDKLEFNIAQYKKNPDTTAKYADTLRDMRIAQEMYARGFEFAKIDLFKVHPTKFQIMDDGKIMPSLSSIEGLGETAATSIVNATKAGPFISKDDFMSRAKVGKSTCELLDSLNLLGDLPESNQISFFDLMG